MPKNPVTDPITDQEIAFAHLILSGNLNDREAAEAAGLNPTTAAYTKSKPRVREYMEQHRAAVSEKLIDQEVEERRKLYLDRGQILVRLWELANLSPETTKGSIAGQVKSMAMIAAIQGLLPNRINGRHVSHASGQPASSALKPQSYVSGAMRPQPVTGLEPANSVTAVEAQPTDPPAHQTPPKPSNDAPSVNKGHRHTSQDNPFTDPKDLRWASDAIALNFDALVNTTSPRRLPLVPGKGRFAYGR